MTSRRRNSFQLCSPSPTRLVQRAANGDSDPMRALFTELYPGIKRLARSQLAHAGGVTGLNATAFVREGFMRMAEREGLQGTARLLFFRLRGQGFALDRHRFHLRA